MNFLKNYRIGVSDLLNKIPPNIINSKNNVIAKKNDNKKIIENFKTLKKGFLILNFDNFVIISFFGNKIILRIISITKLFSISFFIFLQNYIK